MSLQMRGVAVFLRLTAKRSMSTADKARAVITGPKTPTPAPAALHRRHVVSTRTVQGFARHSVAPRGRTAERGALYLHGGAYISGMSPQHWSLVSDLADAGVRVEVPEYGLAPQHTYRDAYPLLTAVYAELLGELDSSVVTIAGDSAGAGLALGLAQTLLQGSLAQPGQLVLVAPWLDLTLANPGTAAAEADDPWLSSVGLREAGRAWAGGDDPTDPRLSPVNGPLAGLAPVQVYIGTRDLFHPDVLVLQQRAAGAGAAVDVTVCEGGVHVYPLVPAPEGRAARADIVRRIAA